MKPTIQFIEKNHSELRDCAAQTRSSLPNTDYFFQPSRNTNGGRCFVPRPPSFLAISRGYFENEARQNFASEAAFFVVMVAIVTPAIVVSLSTLAQVVRSFGSF